MARPLLACLALLLLLMQPGSVVDGQVFKGGSYVVTQSALNDAPGRYTAFLQEAIDYLDNYQFADQSHSEHCGVDYDLTASQMKKQITLQPGSVLAYILSDGLHTQATVHVDATMPVYMKACRKIIFWCICDTVCGSGSIAHLSFDALVEVDAHISWNPSTGQASVAPQPVTVNYQNWEFDGCSINSFLNWLLDIRDLMREAIQTAIVNYINSVITGTLNVPQVFQPYPPYPVYIAYNITNLMFAQNTSIILEANVNVSYTQTDTAGNVEHIYYISDPDDAQMAPPIAWNLTAINGTDKFQLLNGLRLSSTMLTACVWCGDMLQAFDYADNVTILDATLDFKVTWDMPVVKVPATDNMNITVSSGFVKSLCVTNDVMMLDFEFRNLTGYGNVSYTNDSMPGLVIQVEDFNVNNLNISLLAPPVPLPQSVLIAALKSMIKQGIPTLNSWLNFHPFLLPANIAPYVPHPLVHVYNQPGCCDNTHGFVDLSSFCLCTGSGRKVVPHDPASVEFRPLTAPPIRGSPTDIGCNYVC